MPNIKSAIKRTKTNNERRAHNATIKSAMRTAIKQVEASVANNEADKAKTALSEAAKRIDKAVKTGLVHKNAHDSIQIKTCETSERTFCIIQKRSLLRGSFFSFSPEKLKEKELKQEPLVLFPRFHFIIHHCEFLYNTPKLFFRKKPRLIHRQLYPEGVNL